jgi:hypothetical protein
MIIISEVANEFIQKWMFLKIQKKITRSKDYENDLIDTQITQIKL